MHGQRSSQPRQTANRAARLASLVFLSAVLTIIALVTGVEAQPEPILPRPVVWGSLLPERLDLNGRISDRVARVSVTQTFRNSTGATLEGDFLFPLPPGVSVGDLVFEADGREIRGEILEASAARRHYEDVVRRMKDPALLEYAGQNLFRARVFPIPAGATRSVTLSYNQVLPADAGLVEFRFPFAGARMVPSGDFATVDVAPVRSGAPAAVSMTLTLDDRSPLGTIYSPTHDVDIRHEGSSRARISLGNRGAAGWDDFLLYYQLDPGDLGLTLLTWTPPDEDGYFLALGSPGADLAPAERGPLSMLFVLDVSGSMNDGKLDEARDALVMALGSLGPEDRFGIVSFSNRVDSFRDRLLPGTTTNVHDARDYLRDLRPAGGTNIAGALDEAFRMLAEEPRESSERSTLVFFLTDGLPTVGEQNVEGIVRGLRGSGVGTTPHVFSVGVGYDVNTHLLGRLAEEYGGAAEYVTPEESVELKVGRLLEKTSRPLLTDVEFRIDGARVTEVYPERIPFLFQGEQVSIAGRFDAGHERTPTARLTARRPGGGDLTVSQHVSGFGGGDFVARVWASRKVAFLLDDIRLHGDDPRRVEELVQVASRYGIVTEYTSYLADPVMLADAPRDERVLERVEGTMPGLRAESGEAAVGAGRAIKAMKQSLVPSSSSADGSFRHDGVSSDAASRVHSNPIRWVAGKTFYLRGDTWTDAAWPVHDEKPRGLVHLRPFGAACFKLMDAWKDGAGVLALGDRVRVMIGKTPVEISPGGADDLSAEDWSRIRHAIPGGRGG